MMHSLKGAPKAATSGPIGRSQILKSGTKRGVRTALRTATKILASRGGKIGAAIAGAGALAYGAKKLYDKATQNSEFDYLIVENTWSDKAREA